MASDDDDDLVAMPGFRPLPTTGPDPQQEGEVTISPTMTDDDDDPAGWAEPDVEVGPRATSPTGTASTPGSTERLDPTDLEGVTAALVGMASMVIRWARARRRPQMHPQVWIATEEDQELIGKPMARLAARHAPIGGEGSADVVDGVEILMGTTAYALKNLPLEGIPWTPEEDQEAQP